MIDAVIWDFGGVFTSSPFDAFARYERERGLPENLIRQINAANHLENAWARFERAETDLDTFDREFAAEARALGHEVPGRDIIPLLAGDFRPEMIEALRRIRARRDSRPAASPTMCRRCRRRAPARQANLYKTEIMEMFDHLIESSKVGLRKPDPKIYALMCEALGVEPAACVYLDDLGVN